MDRELMKNIMRAKIDTSSDVPPSDAVPLDSCNKGISFSLACSAKL